MHRRRSAATYAIAALAALVGLLVRWPLWPVLGANVPYVTLFPAVMVAAYVGGLRPGLLATVLGAAGAVAFLVEPTGDYGLTTPSGVAGLGLYVLVGVLISLLCESLHRAGRRAEEAAAQLRASEERFAQFMRHLPGLAWIKDHTGRYVFANEASVRAFGTPGESLYGRTDEEIFPPATAAQFRENDRRALAAGAGVQTAETLTHPDGSVHHSLVNKFPIPIAEGQPPLVGGMAIDVTDLRRAEESRQFLAEAGEVLASSLDPETTLTAVARLAVPRLADWCVVHLTDTGGGHRRLAVAHADPSKVEWAEEMSRRYPPDPDDMRGVGRVIRTGEPLLVPEVTEQMVEEGERSANRLAFLRRVGIRSIMIVPLVARGRTLGAVTFIAAESGRKYGPDDLALANELARRAALAVDNARLFQESETALHQLGVLIEASGRLTRSLELPAVRAAILDLSHRLVAADAHAIWRGDPATGDWYIAESAGLSEAYLRGQGRVPADRTVIPERPIVAEDVQTSVTLETRRAAYRAEGIEAMVAVPLRIGGRVSGTLVFYYKSRQRFSDVTVRVAAALGDLAGAALGTAELYQRESELRNRAQEADRAKDEFLAALSHELRNPLAVIVTGLYALHEMGDAAADRLPGMIRQANVLRRLVDDLLETARISRGRIELCREPVLLGDIVRQAVETVRPEIDARRHELTLELPGEEVWLDADPVRLTQCVSNLLHNAAKYTDPGGRIVLAAGREGAEAVVRVRDNGVGLPANELERIFEQFAQVGGQFRGGGLGIGLSLVRRLIEMMGGSVAAHSDGPGRGSEFVLRLSVGAAPPRSDGVMPPTTPLPARPLRVVIADDNVDAAETLAMLTHLWGHEARVANDGPAAVAAIREFAPDVGLLDISMPGFDGYEVARRVRAEPGRDRIVLVAMTGFGQERDRERGAEAGFDRFLVKPVAPNDVEQLLREIGQARPDPHLPGGAADF